jgi:hypothetical protein
MNRLTRRLQEASAVALAATALFACGSCEESVTTKGSVAVPIDVQQKFSNGMRGRLFVSSAYSGGQTISGRTIYIFCDATSSELTIPFETTGFGCVGEISVEAAAVYLSARDQSVFAGEPCGNAAGPPALTDEKDYVASDREVVGKSSGGCKSGTVSVYLSLALKP